MRLSDARSPSAGPSISTRSAPIRRRLARRQPLARSKDAPRIRIASCISAELMTGPPASPKASRKACACSGVRTRPSRLSPASVASRRTRMFSPGSRSQMGSSRPVTSHRRDSVWLGRPSISASHNTRQRSSPESSQFEAASSAAAMGSRTAGRTRRTRASTPPSSNIRDGAGRITAARFERVLMTGRLSRKARASPAASGTSRSRRMISTSSVAAPEAS